MTEAEPPLRDDEKAALARTLAWRRGVDAQGRFLNVFMDQNTRCNLRCRMCGFSDPRAASLRGFDMPRALFDKLAAEVFPLATYVQLSIFTEPFMTSDFPDRLQSLRAYGVPYSHAITNGTLLHRRAILRMIEAGLTRLTISIDGGTAEQYEWIRRGARFDQVVGNVRLLQALKRECGAASPELRINHVVSRWNIDDFAGFLDLVERLRPDALYVQAVERMMPGGAPESFNPLFYTRLDEVRELTAAFCARTGIQDAGFVRPRAGVIELLDAGGARMTCRRPWDTVAIHANGDVHPCMAWTRAPAGNLFRESFDAIWNGDRALAQRREFEEQQPGVDCQHCTIRKDRPAGEYDDFFFRMLSKTLQPAASSR